MRLRETRPDVFRTNQESTATLNDYVDTFDRLAETTFGGGEGFRRPESTRAEYRLAFYHPRSSSAVGEGEEEEEEWRKREVILRLPRTSSTETEETWETRARDAERRIRRCAGCEEEEEEERERTEETRVLSRTRDGRFRERLLMDLAESIDTKSKGFAEGRRAGSASRTSSLRSLADRFVRRRVEIDANVGDDESRSDEIRRRVRNVLIGGPRGVRRDLVNEDAHGLADDVTIRVGKAGSGYGTSVVDGAWTIPIDFRTDDLTDFFEYVAKRRRRRREKRARRRRDQYRS